MGVLRVLPDPQPGVPLRERRRTWFAPPAVREGTLRRPRLMDAMRATAARSLVVVHAPAGYGKTAVLTEWAATDPRPCAWLTVTAAHHDADVLARDLAAAMAGTQPPGGDIVEFTRGAAVTPRPGPPPARPFLLVVDDVDAAAGPVVAAVAAGVPPGSQLFPDGFRQGGGFR